MNLLIKEKRMLWSVILMLALFVFVTGFIIYMVGSNQKMFDSKYSIYMFLPNVEQLNPGAFVTLSGLKVGVVGEMKFTERGNQQGILVELKIDRDFSQKITSSSTAEVKTMGILGDKYIDISLGNSEEPPLEPGMFIESHPGTDANRLIASTTDAMEELTGTLKNVRSITTQILNGSGVLNKIVMDKKSGEKLGSSIEQLEYLLSNLSNGNGTAGKFMQDSTLYHAVTKSARNIEAFSHQLKRGKGTLGKLAADSTFYDHLNSLTVKTDSLVTKLQGEGTTGMLMNDKRLYEAFLKLTISLHQLSKEMQENPEKFVQFKLF